MNGVGIPLAALFVSLGSVLLVALTARRQGLSQFEEAQARRIEQLEAEVASLNTQVKELSNENRVLRRNNERLMSRLLRLENGDEE